jgi:hypothetical protein
MHLDYDFYIFENGCVYDCLYVKYLSEKLNIKKEVFMLCSNGSQQPYYHKGYGYDEDQEKDTASDLVCVCFEKEVDAIHYLSLVKNTTLSIERVHCMTLCKMIEDSNYNIGVIIKKQTYHFMKYIEYMSIVCLEYIGFS